MGTARALRHPRDRLRLRAQFPHDVAGLEARCIALSPPALRLDREASVHGCRPAPAASALPRAGGGSEGAACALAAARERRTSARIRQHGAHALLRRRGHPARPAARRGRGLSRRLRAGEESRHVDPPGDALRFAARSQWGDARDMERRRRCARCARSDRLYGGEARRIRRQARDAHRAKEKQGQSLFFSTGKKSHRRRRRARGRRGVRAAVRARLGGRAARAPRRAGAGGLRQSRRHVPSDRHPG